MVQRNKKTKAQQDYALQIISPNGEMRRFGLPGNYYTIGRGLEATIRINSESISRMHAELYVDEYGEWCVRDLDSRNGTLVNGDDVIESPIDLGDEVIVGDFEIRLLEVPIAKPVSKSGKGNVEVKVTPQVEEQVASSLEALSFLNAKDGGGEKGAASPGETQAINPIDLHELEETNIATLSEMALPKIDTLHLSSLNEFGNRLTTIEDKEERLALLCRLMVRRDFRGESAVTFRVSMKHPFRKHQLLCQPQSSRANPEESLKILKGLLEVLVRTKNPSLASDTSNDGRARIACPIHTTDKYMDILYVTLPANYGTGEWLTLISHTAQTFAQIDNVMLARRKLANQAAVERELKRAKQIQQGLVPKNVNIPGLDIALRFEPSRQVGGDYIDVLGLEDNCALITIADVSGKGLGAAMVASTLHSIVHTCLRTRIGIVEMVRTLNDHLCQHLDPTTFATMLFIAIDPNDGKYMLINAGHPVPVVIDEAGTITQVEEAMHFPLGIQPFDVSVYEGELPAGSLMTIFTDGLTEIPMPNGGLLGAEGVSEEIQSVMMNNPHATLEEAADLISMKMDSYCDEEERHDDQTFMLIRRPK